MTLSLVTITRLEKIAADNGFDLLLHARDGEWLHFGSNHAPLRIWLGALTESVFLMALSRSDVFTVLAGLGEKFTGALPRGAVAAYAVRDVPALHRLVRRAFQLARTLPDEPLNVFRDKTALLPRATEAERLVVQRVGQEIFRDRLLEFWEGRCAITGLAVPPLLRASHIKPWADCETDAERLDVFNGFLLAPHLDAAFDHGFMTVADDGAVIVADTLEHDARVLLGLDVRLRIQVLADGHRRYLPWHWERVFQRRHGDL